MRLLSAFLKPLLQSYRVTDKAISQNVQLLGDFQLSVCRFSVPLQSAVVCAPTPVGNCVLHFRLLTRLKTHHGCIHGLTHTHTHTYTMRALKKKCTHTSTYTSKYTHACVQTSTHNSHLHAHTYRHVHACLADAHAHT